jgi:hypothetical protein
MKITTEACPGVIAFCEEGLKEEALYGTQFEIKLHSNQSKLFYIRWMWQIIELVQSFGSQIYSRTTRIYANTVRARCQLKSEM